MSWIISLKNTNDSFTLHVMMSFLRTKDVGYTDERFKTSLTADGEAPHCVTDFR